jgi:glycosyltransferase involved in cell wall biosynthesis
VREQYGWGDRFVLLFAGNIGRVQGLESVVAAAGLLEEDESVLFVLLGDGVERSRLQGLADQQGLQGKVQFIDRQPAERMPEFMTAADALLVHLQRSELSDYVIPTKTNAYLAAGRPIVMAMEGAAAELVRDARAGMIVPPADPRALVSAVRFMRAMPGAERAAMGERGRQYLRLNLAREKVLSQYEAILQRAAEQRRPRKEQSSRSPVFPPAKLRRACPREHGRSGERSD